MNGNPQDSATIDSRWPLIALVAGAVCIGFAPILVKVSPVGMQATGMWRLLLALPALLLWWRLEPRTGLPTRAWAPWAALAGLGFALDLGLWHWSIHLTSIANATLLSNLAPVLVALGAWWWLDERPTVRLWLGLGIALAGAACLAGGDVAVGRDAVVGDLLGAGSAVGYAIYLLLLSRLGRSRPVGGTLAVAAATGALALGISAVVQGESLWPTHGWWVLLLLGLGVHVVGQGLIALAFARLPAGYAAIILLLQPAVAAVAAWALFGQALGALQMAGACLVLAGARLARR
jgi:drug/metabolite transporter (DMT)-like permease